MLEWSKCSDTSTQSKKRSHNELITHHHHHHHHHPNLQRGTFLIWDIFRNLDSPRCLQTHLVSITLNHSHVNRWSMPCTDNSTYAISRRALVDTTVGWNSCGTKLTMGGCTFDAGTTRSGDWADTYTIAHPELGHCITNSGYWANKLMTWNKRKSSTSPALYSMLMLGFISSRQIPLHRSTGEYQCHSYP